MPATIFPFLHPSIFPWCNRSMSLCEGGGSGANPGGKARFFDSKKVPKRNSRLATPSRWRQPGRHRSGPPFHNPHFAVDSPEALTVMQRPFNPLKQGRYLPGEPSLSPFDFGHGVSVSISPCEGDGTGANPVGQPISPTTPWPSSEAGGCNPPHAGANPAGVSTLSRAIRPTARTPRFQRGNPGAAPGWRSRSPRSARVAQQQRQRVENASSAGASPAAGTIFSDRGLV